MFGRMPVVMGTSDSDILLFSGKMRHIPTRGDLVRIDGLIYVVKRVMYDVRPHGVHVLLEASA